MVLCILCALFSIVLKISGTAKRNHTKNAEKQPAISEDMNVRKAQESIDQGTCDYLVLFRLPIIYHLCGSFWQMNFILMMVNFMSVEHFFFLDNMSVEHF